MTAPLTDLLTDALPFTDLFALALPANIAQIDHPHQIPGSVVIFEVSSVAEAVEEAGGRECGLMHSTIVDGLLYLVIPVEISHVSVVRPGDVLRVDEADHNGRRLACACEGREG
jgi:hypothetical protein